MKNGIKYFVLLSIIIFGPSLGIRIPHSWAISQQKSDDDLEKLRLQRLEVLADLWGKIYLFHPNITRSDMDIDWNQALLETIPKVERARTGDEFVSVLNQSLFKPLKDPLTFATRLMRTDRQEKITSSKEGLNSKTLESSVGYIDASNPHFYNDPNFLNDFQKTSERLSSVEVLIVDLRWHTSDEPSWGGENFLRFFVDSTLIMGSSISRIHEGWNETGAPSVYTQKWQITNGFSLDPIQKADWFLGRQYPSTPFDSLSTINIPTIFVINNASYLYVKDILDALQSKKNISVIWEKTGHFIISEWVALNFSEDIRVHLNTSMLISHTGQLGFKPDFISEEPLDQHELSYLAKRVLTAKNEKVIEPRKAFSFQMRFQTHDAVSTDAITRERRLLGLFKVWNVINYFFPHLEFADSKWSAMLKKWIPRIEAAQSLEDYYKALQKLAAKLNDSHISVSHKVLFAGNFTIPIRLARLEGKVIVVETKADSNGVYPQLDIGDEIVRINGQSIEDLEADWRSRISASTEQALYRNIYQRGLALQGGLNTEVELTVKKPQQTTNVSLRRFLNPNVWSEPKDTRHFKLLEGNLGYINLVTIPTLEALDSALVALKTTGGLILDLRGYPRFWVTPDLTSRLCNQPVKSTIFEIPVVTDPDSLSRTWAKSQYLVHPDQNIYYGKPVIVLINANAQSMAEGFCIYMRNADRVTFVGSGTAGTNGNVTSINLPAGGRMSFTGMRVKFGDGSRFQNIGITPDVEVKPTIQGIIDGKDEVLEKGVKTLQRLIRIGQK